VETANGNKVGTGSAILNTVVSKRGGGRQMREDESSGTVGSEGGNFGVFNQALISLEQKIRGKRRKEEKKGGTIYAIN